jgi:hypothetical protein
MEGKVKYYVVDATLWRVHSCIDTLETDIIFLDKQSKIRVGSVAYDTLCYNLQYEKCWEDQLDLIDIVSIFDPKEKYVIVTEHIGRNIFDTLYTLIKEAKIVFENIEKYRIQRIPDKEDIDFNMVYLEQ